MATKSETSAKAKASVKNVIKIAIGELKKKRKKKGKKRVRKPTPQQEMGDVPQFQTTGNFRNLASPAPPTLSGLLNIGREFRDVQLSQRQLTEQVGTRIRSSERAIRDEVEREYRRMARSLGATQTLTQAQERDIERLTREVRTALGLAGRTAQGLERFTTSGVFQQAVRTALVTLLPQRILGLLQGQEGGDITGFKGGQEFAEAQKILSEEVKKPAKQQTGGGQLGGADIAMKGGGGGGAKSMKGLSDQELQAQIRRQYERDVKGYLTSGQGGIPDLVGLRAFSQQLGVPQNAAKDPQKLAERMLKEDSAQYQTYTQRMRTQYSTPMKGGASGGSSQFEGFEEDEEEEEMG